MAVEDNRHWLAGGSWSATLLALPGLLLASTERGVGSPAWWILLATAVVSLVVGGVELGMHKES